ncbi:hypothetical protein B0H17DRAFT_1232299 [Mycena rosella]|uniref:Uncharacterized protein n=1 Tax=Mycena rosella TaxID=1033263 RepID=A0AAD7G9L5_MYCRO|nr:hypothetical protein B0H17DRAFT_1232299 [Mycena rosella]
MNVSRDRLKVLATSANHTTMLFLLFLTHLVSQRSNASPAYTLDSRATPDSCDDINNCRRLFDIIWGCLTTIFACTWVSVHPNVPPPNQTFLSLLCRRLRMMLVAVIAPELMVCFAARQFLTARWFSKKFGVSITHGFFFSMGGFVSQIGHPIATKKQIEDPLLGPEYLSAITKIDTEDIMDKSKGDALSKGVALVQGLWFTVQCLARLAQHLPITALEVTTLAFAVVNIFTWLLWWGKPLDVQRPIPVGPSEDLPESGPIPVPSYREDWATGITGGYYPHYNPMVSTTVPSFWSTESSSMADSHTRVAYLVAGAVGTVFGTIHCTAWTSKFPSTDEMWMWRSCSLLVATIPVIMGFYTVAFSVAHFSSVHYLTKVGKFLLPILDVGGALGTLIYPIARLFLIVLSFTTLRTLPPGAFTDIDWSVYIPHL